MKAILDELRNVLKRDFGHPDFEWQAVTDMLEKAGKDVDIVLGAVFAEHGGYTETRARAGLAFLRNNRIEGWKILESLVVSADPDDRGTAMAVLRASGDPNAVNLAKVILNDPWPYLRLDAAEFLKETFPDETTVSLQGLLNHAEEWVREEARCLLINMGRAPD